MQHTVSQDHISLYTIAVFPYTCICTSLILINKLNDCVDPDSLNKAVVLLFGLALGNNANNNPTVVSSI